MLDQSINQLSGVGPKTAALLLQLHLSTLKDLLFHLPHRYQDRTRITPIANLQIGSFALIEGEIYQASLNPGRKPSLLCEIRDATGSLCLRFFHFTAQQKQQLNKGARLRCFGEVRASYRHYGLEMVHPEYLSMHDLNFKIEKTLTPIYPTTQGVTQPLLRRLTDQALVLLQHQGVELELLPLNLRNQFSLTDLPSALIYVHRPPPDAEVDLLLSSEHPMQKRLAFEELIAYLLSLQQSRQKIQLHQASALKFDNNRRELFLKNLGFKLTAAQDRVAREIDTDLSKPVPMLRLLQGDVGSGKTVVSALAALRAIASSLQVALMAPSEILAQQHAAVFLKWFEPLGINVGFLGGKQPAAIRKQTLERIAQGSYEIVIGTHALFQEKVKFAHLGLCIIDEQHRFGVHQRLALRQKVDNKLFPHQLIMSATPIPRTLAMSAFADLDVSTIDELPPGRKPIITVLVSNARREEVIERVRLACLEKRQVYWVCTLIQDSETLQCQAAEALVQELIARLPICRIGLVHSRLPAVQKESQMQAFKLGELDLLVATTVIEVGVDVPNASLMIIENPERLGLAQLHQLRGRVGRGSNLSYCVLIFKNPLSALAKQRLQIIRQTQDGFVIAEKDLAMRGPGEIFGARQAGLERMRIADLVKDRDLLPLVESAAQILLKHHPTQAAALISRWLNEGKRYTQA